jgi:4-hydroxythreonine-4-phosphate dehydrogenase
MTALSHQPLLVTMGDPCGIGPECIVKAFARGSLGHAVVVGSVGVMRRAARHAGLALTIAQVGDLATLAPPHALAVIEPPGLDVSLAGLPMGEVHAAAGASSASCIQWAVSALQQGEGCALVTAPIHKAAWAAAGIRFPGHTEMLQSLCTPPGQPAPPVRMMLTNGELSVVLVTIHQSLRSAIDALSMDTVLQTLRITHQAMLRQGVARPRIAVAGLNPHAGEQGLFGHEEEAVIAPAVRAACAEGIDAQGPFPPDTVFMKARSTPEKAGSFDVVVAMTHDHGLIPVKYLGVEHGVNVTLGLPLVRTSPDHGTAFDIAGQGAADPRSLEAAVRYARRATGALTS